MNTYQQKWIDILHNANLPGWEITPVEDNILVVMPHVTDLKVNYTQKRYEIGLSIENLFNTKWNEFEAEEESRLRGETSPVDQMSFTPGTPFFAKLRVSIFF